MQAVPQDHGESSEHALDPLIGKFRRLFQAVKGLHAEDSQLMMPDLRFDQFPVLNYSGNRCPFREIASTVQPLADKDFLLVALRADAHRLVNSALIDGLRKAA